MNIHDNVGRLRATGGINHSNEVRDIEHNITDHIDIWCEILNNIELPNVCQTEKIRLVINVRSSWTDLESLCNKCRDCPSQTALY